MSAKKSKKLKKLSQMSFEEAPYEINRHPDNVREYVSVNSEDGSEKFVVDMTFMLSGYGCIYGKGCCSNRPHEVGIGTAYGCCTESVELMRENNFGDSDSMDDVARVDSLMDELDDSVFANRALMRKKRWRKPYTKTKDGYFMRKTSGGCIFSNPIPQSPDDPPAGCAFHHLATRKNVSHVFTKPEICWSVPLWIEIDDDREDVVVYTITGSSRAEWGGDPSDEESDYISWWCVDTPDAYSDNNPPVYRSEENELRQIMGDFAYEKLCEIASSYDRRTLMPGEQLNGGARTIATIESLFSHVRDK